MKAINAKVTELERQRGVLQKLLSLHAGKAIGEPEVQEALLFGSCDVVERVSSHYEYKDLKWKEHENGSGNAKLMLESELVAVVSYEERGWYWYSMCDEVSLNTLSTNTVFGCKELAQVDCKQHIGTALTYLRG